ncbi:MAG: cytochrome C oxidase subunit II [Acidobacteriota bacterium]|nr:cytochrome C oxidase subunit II [Acidobacteriota bacterium]
MPLALPSVSLIASALPLGGSSHAGVLDDHLLLNLWVAAALLGGAHLMLLAGLLRSRKDPPDKEGPESRARLWRLEFLPLLLLTVLFGYLAARAQQLWAQSRYTGAEPSAMQVEVTGVQFAWYFRYPGEDAVFGVIKPALIAAGEGNPLGLDPSDPHGADDLVSSELVLPAGREVDLRLRAQDVIHGFFLPEMRLKQNALPGETVHVHFTPERPGTYAILCTQLCGLGHYRMAATLRVVPQQEFRAWIRAAEQAREQKP